MEHDTAEPAVKTCIDVISAVLSEADALAKAAKQCAAAGNMEGAFQIALDVEPLLHEANSLVQAAAVIRRRIAPP
jgi:hypothetical protein